MILRFLFVISFFLGASQSWAQGEDLSFGNEWARAFIQSIDSYDTLTAVTSYSEFRVGEVLVIQSRSNQDQVIGFVQIKSIETRLDDRFQLKVKLVRHAKYAFVQVADTLYRMDFKAHHNQYKGTTELILKNEDVKASSSYKPLVFMGLSSGETAQTLQNNEFLLNFLGYLDYGLTPKFTVGSLLPGNVLSAPNFHGKYKFYDSDSNIFSFGANYFQSADSQQQGVVNVTLYWDGVSSESVISHTNLTLAIASGESVRSLTALKGAGTSSFQSGYEFLMDDWNRVLAGPSYNFENKSIGGYISYIWIWDHMHVLVGINTTDVSKLVYTVKDGYYFTGDLYWRF